MIAVIEIKGKQFRVEQGMVIRTLRVEGEPGGKISPDRVLSAVDGDKVQIGQPELEGAKVQMEIVRHAKSPKIIVATYAPKKRTQRKMGYRDMISYLRVKKIEVK